MKLLTLNGILHPSSVVDVQAPFDGSIHERHLGWGDAGPQGAPLLTLSTDEIDREIRDAGAAVLKASAAVSHLTSWGTSLEVLRSQRGVANSEQLVAEGERKLIESRRLLALGIVPRVEVEDLQTQQHQLIEQRVTAQEELSAAKDRGGVTQMRSAVVEMENATAALHGLQDARAKHIIRFPISGTVAPPPIGSSGTQGNSLALGTRVKRGDTLLRIQSTDTVELHAEADETQVLDLKSGQPVRITMTAAPTATLTGTVAWVSTLPTVEPGRSLEVAHYPVHIALDHLSLTDLALLRPGMGGQASIEIYSRPNALALPISFVHKDETGAFVLVLGADGLTSRVSVSTGTVGVDYIEVSEPSTPAGVLPPVLPSRLRAGLEVTLTNAR